VMMIVVVVVVVKECIIIYLLDDPSNRPSVCVFLYVIPHMRFKLSRYLFASVVCVYVCMRMCAF
jgi:hypothetical protein